MNAYLRWLSQLNQSNLMAKMQGNCCKIFLIPYCPVEVTAGEGAAGKLFVVLQKRVGFRSHKPRFAWEEIPQRSGSGFTDLT